MNEIVATMSSKGRLTVPIEIRRALDLHQGDKLVFLLEGHDVKLSPASSRLAGGYRSIPALAQARAWQEVEAIIREESAARFVTRQVDASEQAKA